MKKIIKEKILHRTSILLVFCMLASSMPASAVSGNLLKQDTLKRQSADTITGSAVTANNTTGSAVTTEIPTGPAVTADTTTGPAIPAESIVPAATEPPMETAAPSEQPDTIGISKVEVLPDAQYISVNSKRKLKLAAVLYNKYEKENKIKIDKEKYDNYTFKWYQTGGKKEKLIEKADGSECSVEVKEIGIHTYTCRVFKAGAALEKDDNNEEGSTSNESIAEGSTTVTGYNSKVQIVVGKSISIADIFGLTAKEAKGLNAGKVQAKFSKGVSGKHTKELSFKKGKIKAEDYCKNQNVTIKLKDMKKPAEITINTKLEIKLKLWFKNNKRVLNGYCECPNPSKVKEIKFGFKRSGEKKYINNISSINNKFKHATSKKKQGKYINETPLKVKLYHARAVYETNYGQVMTKWANCTPKIKK